MFCPKCGIKVRLAAKFCRSCGYKLPKLKGSEASDRHSQGLTSNTHLVQSEWTFLLYSLLTFGMYQIYWGWKQWEIVKRVNRLRITPTIRGIFIPLTSFSLFSKILDMAKRSGYRGSYNPGLLATGFFILNIINNKLDTDSFSLAAALGVIIFFISLTATVVTPVIHAMNYFITHTDEDPDLLDVKPNYGLIVALSILFIIVVYAAFTQASPA